MSLFPSFQFKRPQVRQANMYFTAALVVLVAGVVFGLPKVKAYLDQKQAIQEHAAMITGLQESAKETALLAQKADDTFGKELESFQSLVAKVLPDNEAYTDLTKQLDNFFDEHSEIKNNPIIAGSLRFGKGTKLKDSPFSVLPVSLTVESSRENFFTFLNYLETSGSLETGTRLMEVQGVQLNFSEDGISFTLELRAYYRQTQKVSYGNPDIPKIPTA